jgi:hypothetical protein
VRKLLAPAIVLVVALAGAHPFCNLAFHCGCSPFTLARHCNIHHHAPPHCPWCAFPILFAFSFAFALVISGFALLLSRRLPFLLHLSCGLLALFAGAMGAVWITVAALEVHLLGLVLQ